MRIPTLVFSLLATADAFTVLPSVPTGVRLISSKPVRSPTWIRESSTAVAEAPDATKTDSAADDDGADIYAKLGITEDQLSIGVKPEEVLEWIGTREVMVEKAMRDIEKFDRAKAEAEVDKYLMDPEAINYHIEFKKRLADNPDMLQPEEEEGFFSFRTLVIVYITYVFGEVVYRNFLEPRGVDLSFLPGYGPIIPKEEVVDAVSSAVSDGSVVDSVVQSAVEAVDAASTAADVIGNSI
ncbi:expressed unknown protein [Seminavis robusta]|uniref:Uncharacterized protein n=1 Tax=Seminavis robusta TaxID=568900 RepID=A0A9N8E471_9STRA|nr:expressed unknown protein [Seminavis robusta]|eukprot:Sro526_g160360.1 n/a (239) ;mRNA; r:22076-23005